MVDKYITEEAMLYPGLLQLVSIYVVRIPELKIFPERSYLFDTFLCYKETPACDMASYTVALIDPVASFKVSLLYIFR